jgi:hypothetical protein
MDAHIEVPLNEVRRVFDFLTKAHDLMHQPFNYTNSQVVEKFVEDNYEEVKELYYKIVWNWFPADMQRRIEEE